MVGFAEPVSRLFIQRASPAFLGTENLFIVQIDLTDDALAILRYVRLTDVSKESTTDSKARYLPDASR